MYKGQKIGVVDLRLAGYFHITRDSIQRYLHEIFIFLNDEESHNYLALMHINDDKTLQRNTRHDIRKTPINERENPETIQII